MFFSLRLLKERLLTLIRPSEIEQISKLDLKDSKQDRLLLTTSTGTTLLTTEGGSTRLLSLSSLIPSNLS